MGLFSRLGTLIRSNINELINKAEDPEKMLNQVLVDMKSQLVEAKKQVAVAIADEKRLKKQYQAEAAKATEWERKAMLAIKAGDDNLAKAALARKGEHDEVSETLRQQWEAQKQSVEQLKLALRSLDAKIEEAKRKRNILVSRQKRAEAQKTINETLSNINSTSAFDTFERMSDRVTQLEAEAEATAELGGALPEASLEQQFKALEASSGVDDQLAALKSKMALQAAEEERKAIGGRVDASAGAKSEAPPSDDEVEDASKAAEIDAQLEELKRKLADA
ncbi:PspA/IM30 family protein [Paraliomyxa miuraensis]|uniref:PspA/IM30 family protein n=1 Tax=Paraliomyxa miuraensis TaxID=376150 RepID=UPI0022536F03|nr:PspA/IM30 family protein [Paraliomyxa miuraensis]MCX4246677.1 PspA/IM30 family protein [Paraliomyxa miuraensis]